MTKLYRVTAIVPGCDLERLADAASPHPIKIVLMPPKAVEQPLHYAAVPPAFAPKEEGQPDHQPALEEFPFEQATKERAAGDAADRARHLAEVFTKDLAPPPTGFELSNPPKKGRKGIKKAHHTAHVVERGAVARPIAERDTAVRLTSFMWSNGGRMTLAQARDVLQHYGYSRNTATPVLSNMMKAGIVRSTKSRSGVYTLAEWEKEPVA